MASPAKIGITLLTLGSAGVATYGGITYFSQEGKSIKSLIDEKFEYVLLDFTAGTNNPNESTWTERWKTYKTENSTKDVDVLGVKNWNKATPGDSSEALKARCKELSETVVYDEGKANYDNVTKYCSREATAEDEAKRANLKIITQETTDAWNSKTTKKTKLQEHLNKLDIKEPQLTPQNMKTKCDAVKAKKRKETGYKEFYEAYKFVCTSHAVPQ